MMHGIPSIPKILMIIGTLFFLSGLIMWLAGDKLSWFGKLPGDIRIEKENMKIYFPVVTMLLVSVVISLVLWLVRRFF